MIVVGIICLILAWLLPQLVPVPPPIETLLYDGGIILVILGVILLLLSLAGRPVGGRRFWY
jgi:hypothetical protein